MTNETPVPDGRPCTVCWQPWVEHSEQHAERCTETVAGYRRRARLARYGA